LKAFSVVFLVLSLLFSFGAWSGIATGTNTWLDLAIATALVLSGAAFAADAFTNCVVLNEDSISHGSIFRSHKLHFHQIRYRSEYEEYRDGPEGGTTVRYLEFIPNRGHLKALKISKNDFDFDQTFWEWALLVPDLDDARSSSVPHI
jgi:hypothetical protein